MSLLLTCFHFFLLDQASLNPTSTCSLTDINHCHPVYVSLLRSQFLSLPLSLSNSFFLYIDICIYVSLTHTYIYIYLTHSLNLTLSISWSTCSLLPNFFLFWKTGRQNTFKNIKLFGSWALGMFQSFLGFYNFTYFFLTFSNQN